MPVFASSRREGVELPPSFELDVTAPDEEDASRALVGDDAAARGPGPKQLRRRVAAGAGLAAAAAAACALVAAGSAWRRGAARAAAAGSGRHTIQAYGEMMSEGSSYVPMPSTGMELAYYPAEPGAGAAAAPAVAPPLLDAYPTQPPTGPWVAAEQRAREALSNMTLLEKVAIIHGDTVNRRGYAGWTGAKSYWLSFNDGPQGYNTYSSHPGTSTQMPCLLSVAASFDPTVSSRYATAVAQEFVGKGANVLLGPDVEVLRAPLAGRAFESLSGEDPFLGASMVRPFVQAVQALGVIACVKHWLDNNSEDFRQTMSVTPDPRAQHEIYMAVFKAAFEAGAAAVMCSYNKVEGTHACENKDLLQKLLRQELNFRGFVISDWGATHDATRSALAGLDIDMQAAGATEILDEYHKLPQLVAAGAVPESLIDEKVVHVLAAMFSVPNLIEAGPGAKPDDVSTAAHREVAQQTILESAVLIKNEGGTLPLTTAGKKIVMVGQYCKDPVDPALKQGNAYSGGGSGYVDTTADIIKTPLQGMQEGATDAQITWLPDAAGADGADYAIVCLSAHAEEGWDRQELSMPQGRDIINALKGKVTKIVAVAMVPGPTTTRWVAGADAAILLFMPGEQVGPAVHKLLTGIASPSGRLPVSMPVFGEQRFSSDAYPGEPFNDNGMVANWKEGVLVGYRWNDAQNVPAAFPFGFGLAYTTFEFKGMTATCSGESATVQVQVANTGGRDGAAVPQLYVGFPSLAPALRQLRGFQKVTIPAGSTTTVTFNLGSADWSTWDVSVGGWVSAVAKGEMISVSVGPNSADLPLVQTLQCGR